MNPEIILDTTVRERVCVTMGGPGEATGGGGVRVEEEEESPVVHLRA
jgi:hypothetical protein